MAFQININIVNVWIIFVREIRICAYYCSFNPGLSFLLPKNNGCKYSYSFNKSVCRVHCGLLMVCGQGISPHSEFSDVRFGCLPA